MLMYNFKAVLISRLSTYRLLENYQLKIPKSNPFFTPSHNDIRIILFSVRQNIQYSLRGRRNLNEKSYNYSVTYESPLARLRKSWNQFSLSNTVSVPISQFKSLVKAYCYAI